MLLSNVKEYYLKWLPLKILKNDICITDLPTFRNLKWVHLAKKHILEIQCYWVTITKQNLQNQCQARSSVGQLTLGSPVGQPSHSPRYRF